MASPRESTTGPFRDPSFQRVWLTLAANATIVAAATTAVFAGNAAGARQVQVVTEDIDESVCVAFWCVRDNANAAGTGGYSIFVDNAAIAAPNTPVGILYTTLGSVETPLAFGPVRVTINAPGVHIVDIRVVAAVGDETVNADAMMMVEALSFAANL